MDKKKLNETVDGVFRDLDSSSARQRDSDLRLWKMNRRVTEQEIRDWVVGQPENVQREILERLKERPFEENIGNRNFVIRDIAHEIRVNKNLRAWDIKGEHGDFTGPGGKSEKSMATALASTKKKETDPGLKDKIAQHNVGRPHHNPETADDYLHQALDVFDSVRDPLRAHKHFGYMERTMGYSTIRKKMIVGGENLKKSKAMEAVLEWKERGGDPEKLRREYHEWFEKETPRVTRESKDTLAPARTREQGMPKDMKTKPIETVKIQRYYRRTQGALYEQKPTIITNKTYLGKNEVNLRLENKKNNDRKKTISEIEELGSKARKETKITGDIARKETQRYGNIARNELNRLSNITRNEVHASGNVARNEMNELGYLSKNDVKYAGDKEISNWRKLSYDIETGHSKGLDNEDKRNSIQEKTKEFYKEMKERRLDQPVKNQFLTNLQDNLDSLHKSKKGKKSPSEQALEGLGMEFGLSGLEAAMQRMLAESQAKEAEKEARRHKERMGEMAAYWYGRGMGVDSEATREESEDSNEDRIPDNRPSSEKPDKGSTEKPKANTGESGKSDKITKSPEKSVPSDSKTNAPKATLETPTGELEKHEDGQKRSDREGKKEEESRRAPHNRKYSTEDKNNSAQRESRDREELRHKANKETQERERKKKAEREIVGTGESKGSGTSSGGSSGSSGSSGPSESKPAKGEVASSESSVGKNRGY